MRPRPVIVAFDVIETVFSLETLRRRLESSGVPGRSLEVWFAQILRDAFALEVTDVYKPFREVAAAALANIFAVSGISPDTAKIDHVLDGFSELAPHPDADAAFRRLRDANIRIVTLTNGSAKVTEKLLQNGGLKPFVEQMISIEEVRHWKPNRDVYQHAAKCMNVEPQCLALVAAHAWDIHGAGRAGLTTGFVARGMRFPDTMMAPHVVAETLDEVAKQLVELGQSPETS